VCPHRGARLSQGDCTTGAPGVSVPRLVFDESGKNTMLLSEGPLSECAASRLGGQDLPDAHAQGARVRVDGRREPAPIEVDVPEEFFDDALVLIGQVVWRCNWSRARELDGLPRQLRAPQRPASPPGFIARGAQGEHRSSSQRLRRDVGESN